MVNGKRNKKIQYTFNSKKDFEKFLHLRKYPHGKKTFRKNPVDRTFNNASITKTLQKKIRGFQISIIYEDERDKENTLDDLYEHVHVRENPSLLSFFMEIAFDEKLTILKAVSDKDYDRRPLLSEEVCKEKWMKFKAIKALLNLKKDNNEL